MKRLLYLIGIPGSGRTTLLRAALDGVPVRTTDRPIPRRAECDNAVTPHLLTGEQTDVIALGMLLLLSLPTEARIHALACQLWRRFGGVEDTDVRPCPTEWR